MTSIIRHHVFGRLSEGRAILDRIEITLRDFEWSKQAIHGICLALEEGLANAVKHGNRLDPDKLVQFTYQVTAERFEASIEDQGEGFDPFDVPDPTEPENLERGCGRGVFLMRTYMTQVDYNERGNSVYLVKQLENICEAEIDTPAPFATIV